MKALHLMLAIAAAFVCVSGKSLGTSKVQTLPLNRHQRSQKLSTATSNAAPVPLTVHGLEDLVYTVDVKVGSQQFNLTLDTIGAITVLFAKDIKPGYAECDSAVAQRRLYDPSASSTYSGGKVDYEVISQKPYMSLDCRRGRVSWIEKLNGNMANETFEFGSLASQNTPFFLAHKSDYPLNARWASDGVFGLAPAYLLYSAIEQITWPYTDRRVTIFLGESPSNSSSASSGGQITFGGLDQKNCGKPIQVTEGEEDNWRVILHDVNVGNTRLDTKDWPSTYISTATPFLGVDLESFPYIMRLLRYPSYDYDLDLYTVDCSRVASLPVLHFNVGSGFDFLRYDVGPEQYTAKVDTPSGQMCAVLIVEGEYGWALGTRFWPKRCVTFSYDSFEVWFADPVKAS